MSKSVCVCDTHQTVCLDRFGLFDFIILCDCCRISCLYRHLSPRVVSRSVRLAHCFRQQSPRLSQ